MSDEIQRADPIARRRALVLLACGAIVGAGALSWLEAERDRLIDWVTEDLDEASARLRLLTKLLAVALVVPISALTAYLWRLAHRIVRAARFPPPGMRVVRDTRVLEGAAAVRQAALLRAAAALLWTASAVAAVLVLRTGATLLG